MLMAEREGDEQKKRNIVMMQNWRMLQLSFAILLPAIAIYI